MKTSSDQRLISMGYELRALSPVVFFVVVNIGTLFHFGPCAFFFVFVNVGTFFHFGPCAFFFVFVNVETFFHFGGRPPPCLFLFFDSSCKNRFEKLRL